MSFGVALFSCLLALSSAASESYRPVLWERSFQVETRSGGGGEWTAIELYNEEDMREWPEVFEVTLSVTEEESQQREGADLVVRYEYSYPYWTVPFKLVFERLHDHPHTVAVDISSTDEPRLANVNVEVREAIRRQHYTRSMA